MFSLTDFKVLILTQEQKGVGGGGWRVGGGWSLLKGVAIPTSFPGVVESTWERGCSDTGKSIKD